ncbi:TrkA family potassium uptake protein [Vulcanisaeta sp. SCGC AB-777_J10]|nr:TrkA family potassium uptake protein [Vulcanisaeta sp. SCGC AB-777_J10]
MKRAVIVGANNVSIEVARMLADKYEVRIVDSNEDACNKAYKTLKSVAMVYKGDPSDESVLNEVGVDRAELFLALSEDDKLNFDACRVAKRRGVPLIIARVNNRDMEDSFRELGVAIVNVESLVSDNIKSLVLSDVVRVLTVDQSTNLAFAIVRIGENSPMVNRQIGYLVENYDITIPYVITAGGAIKPGNDYIIESSIELVIVGTLSNVERFINEVSTE